MNRDMKEWTRSLIREKAKKPLPVLSAPSAQLLNVSFSELIASSDLQAEGMKRIADRCDMAAAVSLMDLSVEAEAFGAEIRFNQNGVPDVVGTVLADPEDAETMMVPEVGAGRTGLFLETAAKAAGLITDRPVFAGVIGPYSLVGRLMGITEAMMNCYDEPELVHVALEKVTDFLIRYSKAYKAAGSDGVLLAEPLPGMLSPAMAEEFSDPYVKRIIDAVQDEKFAVIYHNCGNNVPLMKKGIYSLGAAGYHFGDVVDMETMLEGSPEDVLIMGNISPSEEFLAGRPVSIALHTAELMKKCGSHANFLISSGCDIPWESPWKNIDTFFRTVEEMNSRL